MVLRLIPLVQTVEQIPPNILRHQHQRVLVHRAGKLVRHLRHRRILTRRRDLAVLPEHPAERIQGPLRRVRVRLQALLQQTRNRALARAHGPVQQKDPPVRPVPLRRRTQIPHQLHQRLVKPVDPVGTAPERVREELVTHQVALEGAITLEPLAHDRVVQTLVRVAAHLRRPLADPQIVPERTRPVTVLIPRPIKTRLDQRRKLALVGKTLGHDRTS